MKGERAIFLDRDGVINKVLMNDGKPFAPRKFDEFELTSGIANTLISFKNMGFLNIVITNQPDVTRGLIEREELNKMTNFMKENLALDDISVCLHDDQHNCDCRKPKPGMLLEASKKWGIDLKNSYFIGDTWKDMAAGRRAGCRTILIKTPYNKGVEGDYLISDINEAVSVIRKEEVDSVLCNRLSERGASNR